MGQRGYANRSREALRAAEVWGSASAVGGRAHVLVVGTEQTDEQGLRTTNRDERSVRLRSYDARDGEAFGSLMRLFRQFLDGVLRSSDKPCRAGFLLLACLGKEAQVL